MKQKEKIEFRYYEVPQGFPLIVLTGKRWEIRYGTDAMHFHNYLEIGICRYGEGVMYFGKETEPYRDGTVTFIPHNFPHHTSGGPHDEIQKWEYLFVDGERVLREAYADRPQYAENMIKRLNSRCFLFQSDEQPDAVALLNIIFHEMEEKRGYYKETVRSILLAFLLKIIGLHKYERERTIYPERDLTSYGSVMKALDYVNQNYAGELKIGDMAKVCNMSETHFRRVFAECMHTSPIRYINLVRVEKACDLIRKSNDRFEDIGVKVGFPVAATFWRNFRNITGYTPMEWREMLKNDENLLVDFKVEVLKGW